MKDAGSGQGTRIRGLDELRGLAVVAVLICHIVLLKLQVWDGRLVMSGEGATKRIGALETGAASVIGWIDGSFDRGYPSAVTIQGWAGVQGVPAGKAVKSVRVSADGGTYSRAVLGIPRPDVLAVYPGLPEKSGWLWTWWFQGVAGGTHILRVKVQLEDGSVTKFERTIIVTSRDDWPRGVCWNVSLGQSGVDMFFVISGFLIMRILLQTKHSQGYYWTFYARRFLRILPLAIVVVFAYGYFHPESRHYGRYALLFGGNLPSAQFAHAGPLMVFWSLGVEEQFYLIMPVLVAIVPNRFLGITIGGLCVGLASMRMLAGTISDGCMVIDNATLIRALPIALGCWMAIVKNGLVRSPANWVLAFLVWLVVLLGIGGRLGLADGLGMASSSALVWLAASGRFAIQNQFLRFMGIHCYGIYLLHNIFLEWLNSYMPSLHLFWFTVLWLAMVFSAAYISLRWFERPLLKFAPKQPVPNQPLLT